MNTAPAPEPTSPVVDLTEGLPATRSSLMALIKSIVIERWRFAVVLYWSLGCITGGLALGLPKYPVWIVFGPLSMVFSVCLYARYQRYVQTMQWY